MLDTASKAMLTALGIDVPALETAITSTAETPYKLTPKLGEIKIGDSIYHVYDTPGHDGLKGRVKNEVLTQATELGVKAVAKAFEVEYTGNDPLKLKAAVEAKLNIPVDEKVKEKDKDILTMTTNWNNEKKAREQAELKLKDREETDRDISFFPENRIKSVKDKTLRTELRDDGITFGEHEENGVKKPAIFKHGEVQKNQDLTLVEPKTFASEYFKTKGWIQPEQQPADSKKKSFDQNLNGGQTIKFDHQSAYDQAIIAGGGKWNEKAQETYTNLQLAAAKPAATA